nr:T-cell differentiation antigen CD6-like [Lytechinus pictus]
MVLCIVGILTILGATARAIDVRLVNGSAPNEGRVEIRHTGSSNWSTVCGTYWDIIDVIVTCRQLGFPGAHASLKRSEFGRGRGRISRTLLFCRGGEPSLNACSKSTSLVCRDGLTAGAVCQEPGYLGCYGDKTHSRALADVVHISRNMTVMLCVHYCHARGYPYAGLEYGEECYCGALGSNYAIYGRYWDSACQHPCSGYANERCGGIGRIAVYNTSETISTSATLPPPVPHTPTSTQVMSTMSLFPTTTTKRVSAVHATSPDTTTKSSNVQTQIINGTAFNAHTSNDEMRYLAVIMGSLLTVGVVVISFILVWNFKLRTRMRAIEDSPLNSTDTGNNSSYEQGDKKAQLVYSDLLTNDVTNNHYESLITSGAREEDVPVAPRHSEPPVAVDKRMRRHTNLPPRIPTYFPQPDLYENYRYSYMQ